MNQDAIGGLIVLMLIAAWIVTKWPVKYGWYYRLLTFVCCFIYAWWTGSVIATIAAGVLTNNVFNIQSRKFEGEI